LIAISIFGYTNNTAGHLAFVFVFAGQEARVRATEAHGQTKSLSTTANHICTHLSGWLANRQGHYVGANYASDLVFSQLVEKLGMVVEIAHIIWCLADDTAELIGFGPWEVLDFANDHVNISVGSSGVDDIDDLGEYGVGDKKLLALLVVDRKSHSHGLSCCGRFIKKTGVRDVHTSEFSDHGLVVEQHLKTALGYLCLVRRVGRVPLWIFEYVSQDNRG